MLSVLKTLTPSISESTVPVRKGKFSEDMIMILFFPGKSKGEKGFFKKLLSGWEEGNNNQ